LAFFYTNVLHGNCQNQLLCGMIKIFTEKNPEGQEVKDPEKPKSFNVRINPQPRTSEPEENKESENQNNSGFKIGVRNNPKKSIPKSEKALAKILEKSNGHYPQEIEEIKQNQGQLFRQKSKLANQLVDMVCKNTGNDQQGERKAIIDQIKELKNKYNSLAEQIRHWEKTGELPNLYEKPKNQLSQLDKSELLQRRNNTRANISKQRKLIHKHQHEPAKLVKYENKLEQLKAELKEIEDLLAY